MITASANKEYAMIQQLKKISFLYVFIYLYLQAHEDIQTFDVHDNTVAEHIESAVPTMHSQDLEEPNNHEQDEDAYIIYFFTQEDDVEANHPSGQYWPAQDRHYLNDKIEINSASAYIDDQSYSEITQEFIQQEEKRHRYLGHFKDPKSDKIIYLYGTKDKYTPNDAEDETDDDYDNDEDTQEDIDIFDIET